MTDRIIPLHTESEQQHLEKEAIPKVTHVQARIHGSSMEIILLMNESYPGAETKLWCMKESHKEDIPILKDLDVVL